MTIFTTIVVVLLARRSKYTKIHSGGGGKLGNRNERKIIEDLKDK